MVSFGVFRMAVREPGFRAVPSAASTGGPNPIQTFRKAICTYHQSGRQAAIDGISLPSPYWRSDARGKTLAQNYRRSLDTYMSLDGADGRQAYDTGVNQRLAVGGEILSIYMDALVYSGTAHTARLALWDVPQPSRAQAEIMASPIITALENDVGQDRAHSVAFWHLRSATVIEVSASDARAKAVAAADAVRRAAGV